MSTVILTLLLVVLPILWVLVPVWLALYSGRWYYRKFGYCPTCDRLKSECE